MQIIVFSVSKTSTLYPSDLRFILYIPQIKDNDRMGRMSQKKKNAEKSQMFHYPVHSIIAKDIFPKRKIVH